MEYIVKCKKKLHKTAFCNRVAWVDKPKVSDGLWICWVDNPTYLPYHFFVHSTIYIFVHSTIYIFVHSTIYIFVHSTIYIAYIHRRSDFF